MKPQPIIVAFNDTAKAFNASMREITKAFEECSRQIAIMSQMVVRSTKKTEDGLNMLMAYETKAVHAGGICGPVWHGGDIIE